MRQRFRLAPPVKAVALPFDQRIELVHNGQTVATARWHTTDTPDGVFQISELHVAPGHQRQGHGSTLLKKIYAEAADLFALSGGTPRRVWLVVEQKRHVIARAFLSRHGFQHVATMPTLYRGQDGMVYLKTFD